ncbi:rab-GTPase-TBC domain-containing protein [Powellomyces hirtus]|nr:rab-GTPase-TBC domain-containing protein [Powellomyces hirtus]
MRSPEELTRGWRALYDDPMLSLERLKERGIAGELTDTSLRSLYWKIYLEYLPLSSDAWPLLLSKERQGYADLKKKYMSDPNESAKKTTDWTLNNPLSTAEESPWTQYFRDTELQKVIRQDVERTFPDEPAFRNPATQDVMTGILFIWCKLNPDVSYRQGMHELLAPILLVVEKDALDLKQANAELGATLATTFDSAYIEHDAAVLFYRLMRSTKPWFEVGSDPAPSKIPARYAGHRRMNEVNMPQVPIIQICRRVQNDLLRVLEHDLYLHLDKHGIEPQLYGLRWFRLLFGREFGLPDLFVLWDGIFAEDANLGLVEWLCVALLSHLKGKLLGKDYSMTMHTLMKQPRLSTSIATQLIDNAIVFRERYTQRALNADLSDGSSPHSAADAAPVPGGEKLRKKRTTVPWVQHTTSPSSAQQNNTDTDSLSPSAADLLEQAPTADSAILDETTRQLNMQVAQLTRAVRNFEERERAIIKKVRSSMHKLADHINDTTTASALDDSTGGSIGVLQSVLTELREAAALASSPVALKQQSSVEKLLGRPSQPPPPQREGTFSGKPLGSAVMPVATGEPPLLSDAESTTATHHEHADESLELGPNPQPFTSESLVVVVAARNEVEATAPLASDTSPTPPSMGPSSSTAKNNGSAANNNTYPAQPEPSIQQPPQLSIRQWGSSAEIRNSPILSPAFPSSPSFPASSSSSARAYPPAPRSASTSLHPTTSQQRSITDPLATATLAAKTASAFFFGRGTSKMGSSEEIRDAPHADPLGAAAATSSARRTSGGWTPHQQFSHNHTQVVPRSGEVVSRPPI